MGSTKFWISSMNLLGENSSLIRANVVPVIFEGAGHFADSNGGAHQPHAVQVL